MDNHLYKNVWMVNILLINYLYVELNRIYIVYLLIVQHVIRYMRNWIKLYMNYIGSNVITDINIIIVVTIIIILIIILILIILILIIITILTITIIMLTIKIKWT